MAVESITKTLGSGSGIDLKALVSSLVDAQYATKTAQLTAKADTLTAQISGVAKLKSAIAGFDSALKSLVKGGTLATQPTSSNTAVLAASLIAGGSAPTAATTLTVEKVATAQAATSSAFASGTTFRGGTLQVEIGSDTKVTRSITVPQGASLTDVAALVKQATGFQTSLVADGNGQRLTVKSATGAAQAFRITASDDDANATGTGLAALATGDDGLKIGVAAQDARVLIDGAPYSRSSNSISNLVPGVKLELTGTGTTTISATRPTAALSQAVSDFVETYNQLQTVLKEETNVTSGVLKNDTAATGIARALGSLTTTKLATATGGGPQTLADVGVATNRDGTLKVDTATLNKVLAAYPDEVESMFATTASNALGLNSVLGGISIAASSSLYGLGASTDRYTKAKSDLSKDQDKISTMSDAMTTRLTQQFSSMNSKVSAYKSTQTFLENQIKAWNANN